MTARAEGLCAVCTSPYAAGDEVGLVLEGWAHLSCWEVVTC